MIDYNQARKILVKLLGVLSALHGTPAPFYSTERGETKRKTSTKNRSKIRLFQTDFILNLINIQVASPVYNMYKLKFELSLIQPIKQRVLVRQVFQRSHWNHFEFSRAELTKYFGKQQAFCKYGDEDRIRNISALFWRVCAVQYIKRKTACTILMRQL